MVLVGEWEEDENVGGRLKLETISDLISSSVSLQNDICDSNPTQQASPSGGTVDMQTTTRSCPTVD